MLVLSLTAIFATAVKIQRLLRRILKKEDGSVQLELLNPEESVMRELIIMTRCQERGTPLFKHLMNGAFAVWICNVRKTENEEMANLTPLERDRLQLKM